MVAESFREYLSRHYTIYICSDSLKQTDRIRAIFEDRGDNISFTAVERDTARRLCRRHFTYLYLYRSSAVRPLSQV